MVLLFIQMVNNLSYNNVNDKRLTCLSYEGFVIFVTLYSRGGIVKASSKFQCL